MTAQAALWRACDAVAGHRRTCDRCLADWAAGIAVRCEVHAGLEAARDRLLTDWLVAPEQPQWV